MIVKYVKERLENRKDPDFTIGKEYIVLGIEFDSSNYPIQVAVQNDIDHYPFLLKLSCFEVLDNRIPEGWKFYHRDDNYLQVEPAEFDGDFWELFHDSDPEAEATFEKVVEKIKHFHGL